MIVHVCDACGAEIPEEFLSETDQDIRLPRIQELRSIPGYDPIFYSMSVELCEDCWRTIVDALKGIINLRDEKILNIGG